MRDIRQGIIDNPARISNCDGCEVISSYYLPKARTLNGKNACFTVSGSEEKLTLRIYGFECLARPSLYEYLDEEWVEYELSSKNIPDNAGNAHAYDGYSVFFDSNGTYSYSFVLNMTKSNERRFKITVN